MDGAGVLVHRDFGVRRPYRDAGGLRFVAELYDRYRITAAGGTDDGNDLVLLDHLVDGRHRFRQRVASGVIGDKLQLLAKPAALRVDLFNVVLYRQLWRNIRVRSLTGKVGQIADLDRIPAPSVGHRRLGRAETAKHRYGQHDDH